MSSADVGSDEDAEQRLGGNSTTGGGLGVGLEEALTTFDVNGVVNNLGGASTDRGDRFKQLLSSVGLEGKLKHASNLPAERKVSVYDIFCNRELRLENIVAIGFDMDYTLAQYKQPAFDKLAFDGAKEKLVHKLGYPEEVLNFEYDHEVRMKRGG